MRELDDAKYKAIGANSMAGSYFRYVRTYALYSSV